MLNNRPKNVLEIAKSFRYRVQIIRYGKDMACLRIFDPYYISPYPNNFFSCYRSYRYVKRLYDSYDY